MDSIATNKQKNYVVLENIRSCYNVGNILRTADGLGRDVILTWYTPSPFTQPKVAKTSLGAENNITVLEFLSTEKAIQYLKDIDYTVISAEVATDAVDLSAYREATKDSKGVAVIFWNEVAGVEEKTMKLCDAIVKISMQWEKESLNVWQTAAIFMRALKN